MIINLGPEISSFHLTICSGSAVRSPTVSTTINQLKGFIPKSIHLTNDSGGEQCSHLHVTRQALRMAHAPDLTGEVGSAPRSPTVSTIINYLKGFITKRVGRSIWHISVCGRVSRNEEEHRMVWGNIDANSIN